MGTFEENEYKLGEIISRIRSEFKWASERFLKFSNTHEGYAVLLEEVDELWENIKLNQSNKKRMKLIKEEAIQVAAMAIRILYDCCEGW